MKLADLQTDKRALVLGATGTGKTRLVGTLCQLVPTVVVTSDPLGLETLKYMGAEPHDVVLIQDWRRCWDTFKVIAGHVAKARAIAIDDLGSVQQSVRQKIITMPRGRSEEQASSRKDEWDATIRREQMLGERRLHLDQWGDLWIGLESWISEILALPYAVKLVTVLEGEAENPRDGEQHIYPNLAGSIRFSLPARFPLVAESFIATASDKSGDRRLYCLTCRSHPRVETKSRYGVGRTWVDPTMTKVLMYMNGQGEPETKEEEKIGVGL